MNFWAAWGELVGYLAEANIEVNVRAKGQKYDLRRSVDVALLLKIPVKEWVFEVEGDKAVVKPKLTEIWGPGITIV